ncbi:hypothetical protein [Virgibacillus ndiopensis]|uniref:hypothetical protein n=1 Tax=Virgibacillus ndiopensis TaxID=2004408 RepID=UPI000C06D9B7|nr:hypothetical protein [Virgibacillus ndiopensis]
MFGVNWLYPFSVLSINKAYTYDPDNVVVDQYKKNVNNFKEFYNKQSKQPKAENITTDRVRYILEMFEQPWLTAKGPVKITIQDLDKIMFVVKEERKTLFDLAFSEDYGERSKEFLKMTIQICFGIEDAIESIKDPLFNDRKTINIQIRNLYMSFITAFDRFTTFYEANVNDEF